MDKPFFEGLPDPELADERKKPSLPYLLEDGFNLFNGIRLVSDSILISGSVARIGNKFFPMKRFKKVKVLAFGYTALSMCKGAVKALGELYDSSLVVTPFKETVDGATVITVPEERFYSDMGVDSAYKILEFARGVKPDEILLILLSGSANKLAEIPVDGMDISALKDLIAKMYENGASVEECNTVQRGFSKFYTEMFKEAVKEENSIVLVISNIPSGAISGVACGPTFNVKNSRKQISYLLGKYGVNTDLARMVYEGYIEKAIANTKTGGMAELLQMLRGEFTKSSTAYHPVTAHYEGSAGNVGYMMSAIVNSSAAYGFPVKRPYVLAIGGNYAHDNGTEGKHAIIAFTVLSKLNVESAEIMSISTSGRDGRKAYAGILADSRSFFSGMDRAALFDHYFNGKIDELFENRGMTLKLKSDLDIGDITMVFAK